MDSITKAINKAYRQLTDKSLPKQSFLNCKCVERFDELSESCKGISERTLAISEESVKFRDKIFLDKKGFELSSHLTQHNPRVKSNTSCKRRRASEALDGEA
eukprot:TRINITY_DN3410_c0_g3_i1.p1 TRINITY_DN3410_c0_g3~~TRINITY_DN3410_c0_g3_i1.p1  ORF type:complete len:102 (-),score=7.39 TRINITY_DN3410_c0_g3_i1:76-381(-)